jgi:dTDP-4-dehydrorhamnose 3,5-epimerase
VWNDPQINVVWPLIDNQPPVLSAKDAQGRLLSQAEVFEE